MYGIYNSRRPLLPDLEPCSRMFIRTVAARGRRYASSSPKPDKPSSVWRTHRTASKSFRYSNATPTPKFRDAQLDDIIPGDLSATLAAHRQSNAQHSFRYTYAEQLKNTKNQQAPPTASENKKTLKRALTLDEFRALRASNQHTQNVRHLQRGNIGTNTKSLDHYNHQHEAATSSITELGEIKDTLDHLIEYEGEAIPKQNVEDTTLVERSRNANVQHPQTILEIFTGGSEKLQDALTDRPWESKETKPLIKGRERLNAEILEFARWMQQDPLEKRFRTLAAFRECYLLNETFPEARFELFGSQKTGLATAISDIDIGFSIKEFEEQSLHRGPSLGLGRPYIRKRIKQLLFAIQRSRMERNIFGKFRVLSDARVPLCEVTHTEADVAIQVVYGGSDDQSVDIIQHYLLTYPQLRPVFLLVRAAIEHDKLANSTIGGLGSYQLLMMLVASYVHLKLAPSDADVTSGLETFLSFYKDLDFSKFCILMDPPMCVPKKGPSESVKVSLRTELRTNPALQARIKLSTQDVSKPNQMVLQNPANLDQNVMHSFYQNKSFKEFCSTSFAQLTDCLHQGHQTGSWNDFPEKLLSSSIPLIRAKRSKFHDWIHSSPGRKEMDELQRFYDEHAGFATGSILESNTAEESLRFDGKLGQA